MIAHGHAIPTTMKMKMMVLHLQAIRRRAPNAFVLGCMPSQSYTFPDDEHRYGVDEKEHEKFVSLVEKRRHYWR